MIVFYHYGIHGGFEWNESNITIPRLWYNFILMGGRVGVNLFVLISEYYLIMNTKKSFFDINRVLKFWGQVIFYSITIYILIMVAEISDFSVKMLLKSVFPIVFSNWWFATTYFVLFLIHPFLNVLLRSLEKEIYQKIIILLVVCWSIIPTITTSHFEGNMLLWFITLYVIAGYVRLYGLNDRFLTKHYFNLWLIFSALTYFASILFMILGTRWHIFSSCVTYFFDQEKVPTLLISLTLFMVFVTLKINYHKWINVIAVYVNLKSGQSLIEF